MTEQTPRAMIALLLVSSVYFLVFFKFVPLTYLLIWIFFQVLLAAFRLHNSKILNKYVVSKNVVKIRQHVFYFLLSNIFQAFMWTIASILCVIYAPVPFELVTFVMIIGIITAAVLSMSSIFYAYMTFFFFMLIPQIIIMIYFGEHQHFSLVLFALIYFPATILLSKSIYNSHRTAIETNDALQSSVAELHKLSITDSLTNIYNRGYFFEIAHNLISILSREKKTVSLLMIDIDHFKEINDTYGHQAGDLILTSFAKIITNFMRQSDIFARVGGEEFAILLHDTSLDGAKVIAEKIRQEINKKAFTYNDISINVTVSIGASFLNPSYSSIEELYKEADNKLYRAKSEGRNRVC